MVCRKKLAPLARGYENSGQINKFVKLKEMSELLIFPGHKKVVVIPRWSY